MKNFKDKEKIGTVSYSAKEYNETLEITVTDISLNNISILSDLNKYFTTYFSDFRIELEDRIRKKYGLRSEVNNSLSGRWDRYDFFNL